MCVAPNSANNSDLQVSFTCSTKCRNAFTQRGFSCSRGNVIHALKWKEKIRSGVRCSASALDLNPVTQICFLWRRITANEGRLFQEKIFCLRNSHLKENGNCFHLYPTCGPDSSCGRVKHPPALFPHMCRPCMGQVGWPGGAKTKNTITFKL